MESQNQRPGSRRMRNRGTFKTARDAHSTRTPGTRPFPPYGRQLALNPPKNPVSVIVCTGTLAWQRAKSPHWMQSAPKLVLPFAENPANFRWPVAGYDCMLFDFGKPEPYPRIVELARELLAHDALFVITNLTTSPCRRFERAVS